MRLLAYQNYSTTIDIFEEVKNHITTFDLAQAEGWKLNKRGNKYWCLCPFHGDKSPSLCIYQGGGFKCYACGEAGADAIALRARLDNVSMLEGARKLIQSFHLPIDIQESMALTKTDSINNGDFIRGLDAWTKETFKLLCRGYQIVKKLLKDCSPEELEFYSPLIMQLGELDRWTDIIIDNRMISIFYLRKELKTKGVA